MFQAHGWHHAVVATAACLHAPVNSGSTPTELMSRKIIQDMLLILFITSPARHSSLRFASRLAAT